MNRSIRILIVSLTLTAVAAVAVVVGISRGRRWERARPSITIPPQSWRLGMVSSVDLATCNESAGPGCAADPANPRLWQSNVPRTISNRSRLSEENPAQFWIGATVPARELQEADQLGAYELVLGWINARYGIWLNGERFRASDWGIREPVVLTLPPDMLRSGKPLSIAILIDNQLGHARPDQLNYTFGQDFGEGFYTQNHASAFRELMDYAGSVRPMALSVANAIAALFFFLLWGANKEKQEYFQLAVFTLWSALFQLVQIDAFLASVHPATAYQANFYVVCCEGLLGFLLALSFARTQRRLLPLATLAALLLPVPLFFMGFSGLFFQKTAIWVNNYANPSLYFLGAAACLRQLFALRSTSSIVSPASPTRTAQLRLFGIGMAALGACSLLQGIFWCDISFLGNLLMYRSFHFVLVLYLGWVALREYRQQLSLLRKTPVSPYHRRAVLPERVTGAVLCVDLKSSEWLFRAGAKLGDAGSLASACLSHLWAAAAEQGGCVLQTSGDGLIAFFDCAAAKNPAEQALLATDTMAQRLAEVLEQFREQGIVPAEQNAAAADLRFRAGLAYGDIRPIWQETKEERRALWAEAGQSNPLLEAARLMELERSLDSQGNQVVVAQELARTAMRLSNAANQQLPGKHGKIYEFSIYQPQSIKTQRAA